MTVRFTPRPINLSRGWPHPSLHPTSALSDASKSVLCSAALSEPALGYGPDEGDPSLRAEIARWLTTFYQPREAVDAGRIVISGGASQNLACVLQVYTDPVYTRNVWLVSPTYYLACPMFEDAGFGDKMRAVREDAEGIDLDFLERELKKSEERAEADGNLTPKLKLPHPWRKIYKHIIYAVPTFANPSSRIMSVRRRTRLVRLARQYDALVVTDDVYDFLQWHIDPSSTQPQLTTAVAPRLVDIDRFLDGGPKDEFGNCMSNGSFSKLLGPGCRVGWVEGTEKFAYGVGQTGSSRSGGAPSQLTSTFIRQLLSSGFIQSYIPEVLCPTYSKRYHILRAAIEKYLHPLGMTFTKPLSPSPSGSNGEMIPSGVSGGYFFWLRLPPGIEAKRVTKIAAEELNLQVADGEGSKVTGAGAEPDYDYANTDEPLDSFVRICLAYVDEDLLEEGIQRLAQAVEKAKLETGC
ncbi:aminotransferase [Nannizzia gypsea CBS 118893]|uniref:Aminotransferase n=1 Tax=Arthroderma gypseum (strain ATCC MYA-4604 / CBS 118893) TaxID=535722 RepID=E4V229_ARTGP|nr:aminotransferase [Nannizzia gypsea CBS 118893]EFR04094.1 aminotransferase [Nannizzia gypsea CBS 118893]